MDMPKQHFPTVHLLWADSLKIIAMFGVVLIHSAAPLLIAYRERGPVVWWIGNLYDSLARCCIPIFFMLSGALLLNAAGRMPPGVFLRRRFRRIGIPFLFWSAVYFIWEKTFNRGGIPYLSFLGNIIREPTYYHLWFLYVLMGLYLIAPLLGIYVHTAGRRNKTYLLMLWLAFGSIVPFLELYFDTPVYFMASTPNSVFRYAGFFMLGHFLHHARRTARHRIIFAMLFIVGFAATLLGTYFVTVIEAGGTFNGVFYEYYSPNVALMAAALFMLWRRVPKSVSDQPTSLKSRIITMVAAGTPGVYLVHALVISILNRGIIGFALDQFILHPSLGVPLFAIIVFVVSLGIVSIMRTIPGMRELVIA
ncbi:MAG: acyltransferase family protein [Chitinivibrionales bacterium]|nr:acyltransferase family protein [Chitinivibrionales bacterium]